MDAFAPILLEAGHGDRHAVGEKHPVRLRATNLSGEDLLLILSADGDLLSGTYRRTVPLRASESQHIRAVGEPPSHGGMLECRVSIEIQTMEQESRGLWIGTFERRVEGQTAPSTIINNVNVSGGAISAAQGLVRNNLGNAQRADMDPVRFEVVELRRSMGDRLATRIRLAGPQDMADLHLHAAMPFVLGRATDDTADLVIGATLTTVSRRHCQFELTDDRGVDLVHLSTVNPTRLDGHDIGARTALPLDRTSVLQLGQDQGGPDPSVFLCTIVPIPCGGLVAHVSRHLLAHGEVPSRSAGTDGLAGLLLCVHDHSSPRITAEHLVVFSAIRLTEVPVLQGRPEASSTETLPSGRTRGERAGVFRCPRGGLWTAHLDQETGDILMAGLPSPNQRIGSYRVG